MSAADIVKYTEFMRFDRLVHMSDFHGRMDKQLGRTFARGAQLLAKEYPDFVYAFRQVHPNKTVLLDEVFKEDLLNAPR